jgi:3-oxoacyl-[acyl-carrier protein] reductase
MKNTQANTSKVALVTGSSRGIGAAIVKRLAAEGFAVVINYAGRATDANAVVQEIQAAGGRATAIQADVSSAAEVAAMFDQIETTLGGLDVLVNNAGIMHCAQRRWMRSHDRRGPDWAVRHPVQHRTTVGHV